MCQDHGPAALSSRCGSCGPNRVSPVSFAQIKAKFGDSQMQILKATLRREATLIQRNSFIYIFRAVQVCPSPCCMETLAKEAAAPAA